MTIDKNLIQRTLAGIVFLAVMIFCIWYNKWTVSVLLLVLIALSVYELTQLVGVKTGKLKYRFVITGLAVLAGLVFCYSLGTGWHVLLYWRYIPIVGFGGAALLFILPNTIEQRLVTVVTYIFAFFYLVIPFLLMRFMTGIFNHHESWPLLSLFILVWTNDTMAYVCGRLFGKHKLSPGLSPKKTWEGFIGGVLFTCVAAGIMTWNTGGNLSSPAIWIMSVAVSIFATIGDLFESAIKRWVGVKDSGNLIPGHGGILDRFDGAIFAIWPYFFLILLFWN